MVELLVADEDVIVNRLRLLQILTEETGIESKITSPSKPELRFTAKYAHG